MIKNDKDLSSSIRIARAVCVVKICRNKKLHVFSAGAVAPPVKKVPS